MKTLKPGTVEQQLTQIDGFITNLIKHQPKRMSAAITPYPISTCILGESISGLVLGYMFCCDGVVTDGTIYLGNMPKGGVELAVVVSGPEGGQSRMIVIKNQQESVQLNLPVLNGERLKVFVNPVNTEEKITEVWLAFMWSPAVKNVDVQSFLISELEALSDNIEEHGQVTE